MEPLKDVNAKVGQTVTLETRISNAKAEVKWYRDGYQVYTIDRYTVVKEGQRRALTIKKVGPEDIGRFRCQCGDVYTEANLSVKGEYTMTIPEINNTHLIKDMGILKEYFSSSFFLLTKTYGKTFYTKEFQIFWSHLATLKAVLKYFDLIFL